jgi:hypothetical protein
MQPTFKPLACGQDFKISLIILDTNIMTGYGLKDKGSIPVTGRDFPPQTSSGSIQPISN